MSPKKFTLLDKKHVESAQSGKDDKHILSLRKNARVLQAKNNELAKQLWDVEFKLIKQDIGPEQLTQLTQLKETITQKLIEENYVDKINRLLEVIQTLEISLYGHSDVNGNSPYTL